MRTISQIPAVQPAASNWWAGGDGIDAAGITPQGELLLAYPEKLTIPSEAWVTDIFFILFRKCGSPRALVS